MEAETRVIVRWRMLPVVGMLFSLPSTGFGTVVNALNLRMKAYLPQVCGVIKWRLKNRIAKVRQQAADLIARTAVVMKACQYVAWNGFWHKVQKEENSTKAFDPVLVVVETF